MLRDGHHLGLSLFSQFLVFHIAGSRELASHCITVAFLVTGSIDLSSLLFFVLSAASLFKHFWPLPVVPYSIWLSSWPYSFLAVGPESQLKSSEHRPILVSPERWRQLCVMRWKRVQNEFAETITIWCSFTDLSLGGNMRKREKRRGSILKFQSLNRSKELLKLISNENHDCDDGAKHVANYILKLAPLFLSLQCILI